MIESVPAEGPDLWFQLPPGFTQIDLHESPEARMEKFAEAIAPMYHQASPEQKLAAVLSSEQGVESLLSHGAVHLSHCLFRRADEDFAQGMLTLFIQEGNFRERGELAQRMAHEWARENPGADVAVLQLPYGPAAAAAEERDTLIPGAMYGVTEDEPATVRQLRVALPLFSGERTALFVFTTQELDDWQHFVEMVVGIVQSVSHTEPRDEKPVDAPRSALSLIDVPEQAAKESRAH